MDDNNDGGIQEWEQVGKQEYMEWLADPVAQEEYQAYLKTLETKGSENDL